jgi:hypothetical protein
VLKEVVMLYRVLSLCVLGLALAVALPALASQKDKDAIKDKPAANTHEGTFVSARDNKFTMLDKDGKTEHTHTLAADAKVTCDGKDCKITDFKKGLKIKVTTKEGDKDMAVKVEGSTKDTDK